MKSKGLFFLFAITSCVLLLGCNNFLWFLKPVQAGQDIQRSVYNAETQPGKVYQQLLNLTINAITATIEKTLEYNPELAEQTPDKMTFNDLILRADLARTIEGSCELTLKDELDIIVSGYNEVLSSFISPEELSGLDGKKGISLIDRLVLVGDDIILLNPASLEGIIKFYLIQSHLAGENMEAIINDMHQVVYNYPVEQDGSRSLVEVNRPLWPSGNVYFCWASDFNQFTFPTFSNGTGLTPGCKSQFIQAFIDWNTGSPGISFVDIFSDPNLSIGYTYMANLNQVPLVTLCSFDPVVYPGRPGGFADVGAKYGKALCTMQEGQPTTTARHELGHTLGLWHEHMRGDRDDYIDFGDPNISAGLSDWTEFDYNSTYLIIPITVNGNTYDMFYPYYHWTWTYPVPGGSVELDYLSIMIYDGIGANDFTVKVAKQGLSIGDNIPYNTSISAIDRATINWLYP